MPNENRPPGGVNAGTGINECRQRDYTTPRRQVNRKPARRITKADRDALAFLYGPQESLVRDEDESKPKRIDRRNGQSGDNDA